MHLSKILHSIFKRNLVNLNLNCSRALVFHRKYTELMTSSPVRLAYARIERQDSELDYPPPAPLLICHGLFGAKKNWRSIGKALSKETRREVITLDARNHGSSEHHPEMNFFVQALDAKQLLEELDISKVVIIGHSMGGKAAMTFALSYPDSVDKVIIIDSSPSPSVSDEDIQRYLKTKLQMDLSQIRNKKDAEKMMMHVVQSPILRQFFLTNLVQLPEGGFKWRINLEAIDNNLQEIMSFPPEFPYKEFMGETIFIGGARSNYIQKKDYERIYKLFPKAEITYIPDCGHWVHAEKPRELVDLIEDFLIRYP